MRWYLETVVIFEDSYEVVFKVVETVEVGI